MALCECGCGMEAPIAVRTRSARGEKAGDPLRFVKGHHLKFHVPAQSVINYPVKLLPDGRVRKVHRIRAERALGKPLPRGAEVHHVDGSKSPASPLVICQDSAYHQLLHVRTRVLRSGGNPNTDKICATCKAVKAKADFQPSTFTHAGLQQSCRECERSRKREYWRRKATA